MKDLLELFMTEMSGYLGGLIWAIAIVMHSNKDSIESISQLFPHFSNSTALACQLATS
jgi:VIT1/CCC1 family predicted Fe2+/Mn2+ transporter